MTTKQSNFKEPIVNMERQIYWENTPQGIQSPRYGDKKLYLEWLRHNCGIY